MRQRKKKAVTTGRAHLVVKVANAEQLRPKAVVCWSGKHAAWGGAEEKREA